MENSTNRNKKKTITYIKIYVKTVKRMKKIPMKSGNYDRIHEDGLKGIGFWAQELPLIHQTA